MYLLNLYTLTLYNQFILYLDKNVFIVNQYMYFKFPLGIYFEGKACYVKFYAYMY